MFLLPPQNACHDEGSLQRHWLGYGDQIFDDGDDDHYHGDDGELTFLDAFTFMRDEN